MSSKSASDDASTAAPEAMRPHSAGIAKSKETKSASTGSTTTAPNPTRVLRANAAKPTSQSAVPPLRRAPSRRRPTQVPVKKDHAKPSSAGPTIPAIPINGSENKAVKPAKPATNKSAVQEASKAGTSNPTAVAPKTKIKIKIKPALKEPAPDVDTTRGSYADRHRREESRRIRDHAQALFDRGIIEETIRVQLSDTWKEGGIMEMEQDPEYDDSARADSTPMISPGEAESIQREQDAAREKWLQDWRNGTIDDYGDDPKEKGSATAAPASAAVPAARAPRKAGRTKKPDNFIVPEDGANDYEEFKYEELAGICRQRQLSSGGNRWAIIARLILDDKAVKEGKDSERDAAKYVRSSARGFKTKTPVLENDVAPAKIKPVKRKRPATAKAPVAKRPKTTQLSVTMKENAVDHPGLRLRLSDFTYDELAQKEMGDEDDAEIHMSGLQLWRYLAAAESRLKRTLGKRSFAKEVKTRRRSETPPEEMGSSDEARYAKQEERAAKRTAYDDIDYEDTSSIKSLSE
ncbi:hypothetical protein K504DRAFT_533125 [Pleomassaria siparia CBS 279.74]|uniref:Uncharacterized protein n=1 Tax=Pleomassaria siparia CBS 279.74 TaxID=1314801 RepID=A0A6G1KBJ0_9PLEO|nr:hypothetical protein K504DRAFT_533125 [Pleomassaria siparia CBS 279.74]